MSWHLITHLVKGFDWESAPWFDANGLNDIAPMEAKTVVERLQEQES